MKTKLLPATVLLATLAAITVGQAQDGKPPVEATAARKPEKMIKVFPLVYASADEVRQIVSELMELSKNGAPRINMPRGMRVPTAELRISADPRTNSLIAKGPEAELQVIEALVERLDVQVKDGVARQRNAGEDLRKRVAKLEKEIEQLKARQPTAPKIRLGDPRQNPSPKQGSTKLRGSPIRCEVVSPTSGTVRIRSIVAAGQYVEEGDLLVEFDSSPFREIVSAQKAKLHSADLLVRHADSDRRRAEVAAKSHHAEALQQAENAELSLSTYLKGTRLIETKELEAAVAEARLELQRYQAEANASLVKQAQLKLEVAELRLDVFQKVLAPGRTKELENAVVAAKASQERVLFESKAQIRKIEAAYAVQRVLLDVEQRHLDRASEQLRRCRVVAPHAGVVANGPTQIHEGTLVRQGQVLLLLRGMANPDTKKAPAKK